MIGSQISYFNVTAKLGEGGMGEVYRATDTRLNRDVAIKVLPESFLQDPQRAARFEREAQLLASLNHTNIAGIHGLETDGGQQYLILELVEGETLAERIARGRMPLEEALGVAQQIAEALEAAHDRGIIHRDLKPANVKLTPKGEVKVLDFGLAKALEIEVASGEEMANSPTLSMAATQAGIILGTAAYMAPEQAAGQPADRRADVWSFGAVLVEMLTGRQLFTGETASHVLAAVLQQDVDLAQELPDVPAPIRKLLIRCLEKKARLRLQAIGEARIAIDRYLADPDAAEEPAAAAVEAATETRSEPLAMRMLPWAVAAVAIVAAVLLGLPEEPVVVEREVVRFDIDPPAEGTFQLAPTAPGPVAVSPDGRSVVFAASGADVDALYVRELDEEAPRSLNGTEGAQYPFWSPDSRSIGFFADGKLKRIDVGGGPAVSLCDANNGKGGSWSETGVILFTPTHDSPIHRVAEAGGESTPVTSLEDDERDNSHRHPQFLPGGGHFIYLARLDDPDNHNVPEVRLRSVDGAGEERVLLRSESSAHYASGHLLFVRETTLMARPFDAAGLEFVGDAVPVAEDVTLIGLGAGRSVFGASTNGLLAYQTGANDSGVELSWRDRSGTLLETVSDIDLYGAVALSPDEATLAVATRDSETGTRDIWIIELERDVKTRFTFDPSHDDSPVWSPDGQTLYFSSARDGSEGSIYRKSVFGSGEAEAVLEADDLDQWPSAVTADGRHLVLAQVSAGEFAGIWVLDLEDGAEAEVVVDGDFIEIGVDLSPDGRWLLYVSNESGQFELYATSFPVPARKWQISTDGVGFGARWSGDGAEIAFFGPAHTAVYTVPVESRPDRLVVGRPERLFDVSSPMGGGLDLTAQRDRFIVAQALEAEGGHPLSVILNWPDLLKQR